MANPATMYRWRKMSDGQRAAVLQQRREERKPWHSPTHYESDETTYYMITAACFEHQHVIGVSPERMSEFEDKLLDVLESKTTSVFAWCVLPNHYHTLVDTRSVKSLLSALGKLHGRTSLTWNDEDGQRGRQVWFNAVETAMKSEGHYYASLNYVLNNAVHHGYADKWTDWPYCNAQQYLDTVGRERAVKIWNGYPLYDYGKDCDPPDL